MSKKKYRDFLDEVYEDRKPSKKERALSEEKRREKKINNAIRSNNYEDLIDEDDWED